MALDEKESRELAVKEAALELKRLNSVHARKHSPLWLLVVGALLGGLGNAGAILLNGYVDYQKAEQARILEMLKAGNIKQVAENLKFLLKIGLVSDTKLGDKVQKYLDEAPEGTGPLLTVSTYNFTTPSTSTYNYATPNKREGAAPAK